IEAEVLDPSDLEGRARRFVEKLALALQASLLHRHAPPAVADAFSISRLGGDWGRAFGTLPLSCNFGAVLNRARASGIRCPSARALGSCSRESARSRTPSSRHVLHRRTRAAACSLAGASRVWSPAWRTRSSSKASRTSWASQRPARSTSRTKAIARFSRA